MAFQGVTAPNGFDLGGATRSATVKWNDTDARQIVSWLSERDRAGVRHNLDDWNKGNKQHAAEKMLRVTGLSSKAGVDKRKACDKIKGMINSYKKWRTRAETTAWGINPLDHDKPANDELPGNGTIRQLLLRKCPWFYDFEDFFHDHPNMTAAYMIESGGLDRENGCVVPANRDDNEEDSPGLEGNGMADSPASWVESDQDGEGQEESDDMEAMTRTEIQPKAIATVPPRPASDAQHPTMNPVSSRKQPNASSNKRPRPASLNIDENAKEGSPADQKRKRQRYGRLSIGEALIQVETIRDVARKRAEDQRAVEFEAEMRQRDQHHQLQMGKQEEVLLRLRLELRKQEQIL